MTTILRSAETVSVRGTQRGSAWVVPTMFTSERGCGAYVVVSIVLATQVSQPSPATAQSCDYSECVATASFSEHVTMLAINSLIGGVAAGVVRMTRGEPIADAFYDGFLRGALGGGLTYAGKGVASQAFSGAGLLGRQIAALGVSTTANAADGVGFFDRVVLSLGPLPGRLVISRRESGLAVYPQADLISTAAVIYGFVAPDYSPDWGASLSGGIAVFRQRSSLPDNATLQDVYAARARAKAIARARGTTVAGATTAGGATFVSYLAPDERVIAHERVHAVQFDFLVGAVGDQVDTWAMTKLPGVDRWLKINLMPAFFGGIHQVILLSLNHAHLPWEREAALLTGYR